MVSPTDSTLPLIRLVSFILTLFLFIFGSYALMNFINSGHFPGQNIDRCYFGHEFECLEHAHTRGTFGVVISPKDTHIEFFELSILRVNGMDQSVEDCTSEIREESVVVLCPLEIEKDSRKRVELVFSYLPSGRTLSIGGTGEVLI